MTSGKKARLSKLARNPAFIAAAVVLTCVVTAVAADKADVSGLTPREIIVSARPIDFASAQPDKRVFGRLTFVGGMVLNSSSDYFGGYSGLVMDSKGERFLAISDSGSWLSGKLGYKDGRPVTITEARVGPIPTKEQTPLRRGHRDAEAIVALKPGSLEGRYLIAFERRHRIEEYAFEKGEMRGPLAKRQWPPQLKGMKSNSGLESATMLRGGVHAGAVVVFSEKLLTGDGRHTGALVKDGKSHPLFMVRNEQFDISDMQSMSDGSLIVVERSFIPAQLKLGIRLRLIKAADVKPGATLDGETLLDAGQALEIDNFEGVAIHETPAGDTVLTLISDDNFSFLQRTLLMQFKLREKSPTG